MTFPSQGQSPIVAGSTFEGRYEILAEIGSGGFGTVYRAAQLATGQHVAIKTLRIEAGSGPSYHRKLARFLREMRLCGVLHHPNIVRLIDSGHREGGPVYTVFELVPGMNLSEVLALEGALDPVEARHLMLQVLDGLSCAHGKGIVHRDLKPKNIMITTGARRNALILDFGIGAITGTDHEEHEDLTVTGEMLGSPGYAAPEQFLRARPTPRSDLFSWALVFLECLTGVAAEPLHKLVLQRLDPEPVVLPPSIVGHPLGEILRRALVKDVSAREVTAENLLRQLEGCDVRDLPLSDQAREITEPSAGPSSRRLVTARSVPDTLERTAVSGPRHLRRERRQVTAVSCHVEVRARGARPEDLEDADEELDAVQRLVAESARRHGGWVVSAAPDGLVACFGYPTARNDDATRALQTGLAIQVALQQRALGASPRWPEVSVSVGVHTGMVMARDTSEAAAALGPIVGTTLRVAVEIARHAASGSVLASADTQRLGEAAFDFAADGAPRVEVGGAAVETFVVGAAHGLDVPTPASVRQTPLVGRESDLAAVLAFAERARGGAGHAVLVHGEPGIGKSRLVREVVRGLVRSGFTVLEGRSTPDATHRALHPFIDWLERTLELGRNDGSSVPPSGAVDRLRKVEGLVRSYELDVQEAVPLLATLLGIALEAPYRPLEVSPSKLKEMTGETLRSLLVEMAHAKPVLLVLEDLHWSDPTTRELLSKLTAEAAAAPLLILMTARPEFVPAWSPSSVTSVSLGRLGRAEAELLVAKATQGTPLPATVLDRIIDRTDGVPLFIEELVSMILGSGELVARHGRYELTKPLSEVNVPTTLRASLTARLDRLGRAKQVATVAAVIGREFRLDVLTALSTAPESEVRQDLEMLVASELVHGRRRRRESVYSFKHALVRDAAYELLPRSSRQEIHARLAGVLENQFPDVVATRPDLLAKHHAAAHQVVQAIGYAKRAAMGALGRSANAEVIAGVEDALGWAQEIEGEKERATAELELNSLRLMAQMATHGYGAPPVGEVIARCQELLPLVGDGPLATGTRWATLMYHHIRAERKPALALAKSLVGAAEACTDRDQLAAALPTLGQCFYLQGQLTESRAHFERAVSVYEPEKHRHHALVYGLDSNVYARASLALVLWLLGYRDEAWAHGEAAIAWARELRHAPSEAVALLYVSGLPHYENDRAKVIQITEALNQVVERYGLFMYKAFCGVLHGWANGDAAEALRGLEHVRMTGQEIAMSYFLSLVAECEAASGDYVKALSHIDEALSHAQRTGELYYEADLFRLKGAWLGEQGPEAWSAAESSLHRAIGLANERSQRASELRASLALGRLLATRGRAGEGRDLVKRAIQWHEGRGDWGDLAAARRFVDQSNW